MILATDMLWTLSELSAACGIESKYSDLEVKGISIDSRTTKPGDLFVALAGDPGPKYNTSYSNARDGHDFIPAAEKAGAGAILVSRNIESNLPRITLDNTLDGLWLIAEAARERMEGEVIGITGSSGKTTARTWLEEILAEQAPTHASPGSFNNHWGVPLSLARMPMESDFGVFEIGMNHPGEIEPLSKLVRPDVALVLNVLPAHLGSFENIEGIRREKLSIANGLSTTGTLVVHEEIDVHDVECQKTITFGLGSTATVSGIISYTEAAGIGRLMEVDAVIDGSHYFFTLDGGGEHRVLTALACLATVYALRGDIHHACRTIPSLKSPAGRGNVVTVSGRSIIDDSYNANPVSMRYAIEELARSAGGRRIALLGEMLELGPEGEALHASLMESCQSLDGVITVGEGFAGVSRTLGEIHLGHYETIEDFDIAKLVAQLEEGDVILVKGSNKIFWVNGFVTRLAQALKDDT
jgi:UDP-N-acetylmuramoyl-tripeptide--D-alanyl-D-alanine ligase